MSSELSWKSVGERLSLLRKAYGHKHQNTFAPLLDAKPGQYNHWERGKQIIPVEYAARICILTGATLDYIYLGKTSGLPMGLASELRILPVGLLGSSNA
jgi:transcriptional regulator with XRE-family HTH domain